MMKMAEVRDTVFGYENKLTTTFLLRRFALAFIHSHSGATGVF